MKQRFDVTGMHCAACSANVDKAVRALEGVSEAAVALLNNSMTVEYDESQISADEIIKAVEGVGFGCAVYQTKKRDRQSAPDDAAMYRRRLVLSAVFALPLSYIAMGHMLSLPLPAFLTGNPSLFAGVQLGLIIPVILINLEYFINGFASLMRGAPNMNTLISIGATAAFGYGIGSFIAILRVTAAGNIMAAHDIAMGLYFESAGMILTLITLGKFLEARAKRKTGEALNMLLNLTPDTARVYSERDGGFVEVLTEEISAGDLVEVTPGGMVPVDGVIEKCTGSFDLSALTGESIPVEKSKGDDISSGSMSIQGYFVIKATRVGEDTTLKAIARLVDEASSSKAPISRLADKVSAWFVPAVMIAAAVTFAAWLIAGKGVSFAVTSAICVLVISCPCALGLATPTAIMVGTGAGARNHILFSSAAALETLHKADTAVLDKTGTLTEGKPRVTEFFGDEQALSYIYSLERMSEHPLSSAVCAYARLKGAAEMPAEDFAAVPGMGISGLIEGRRVAAGNRAMAEKEGFSTEGFDAAARELSDKGRTIMFLFAEGEAAALLGVADEIKESSREAVAALSAAHVRTIVLSGDTPQAARAAASACGADGFVGGVLPADKEAYIRELQSSGHIVAMIGDGINDAPALSRADVGIAIGAGADIARQAADVVLTRGDLRDAYEAVRLSRAVIRNIKQNLFWALFYNALLIPLAAGVFYGALGWQLDPMLGAAAMSLSSVTVVSNALRLRAFKTQSQKAGKQQG